MGRLDQILQVVGTTVAGVDGVKIQRPVTMIAATSVYSLSVVVAFVAYPTATDCLLDTHSLRLE